MSVSQSLRKLGEQLRGATVEQGARRDQTPGEDCTFLEEPIQEPPFLQLPPHPKPFETFACPPSFEAATQHPQLAAHSPLEAPNAALQFESSSVRGESSAHLRDQVSLQKGAEAPSGNEVLEDTELPNRRRSANIRMAGSLAKPPNAPPAKVCALCSGKVRTTSWVDHSNLCAAATRCDSKLTSSDKRLLRLASELESMLPCDAGAQPASSSEDDRRTVPLIQELADIARRGERATLDVERAVDQCWACIEDLKDLQAEAAAGEEAWLHALFETFGIRVDRLLREKHQALEAWEKSPQVIERSLAEHATTPVPERSDAVPVPRSKCGLFPSNQLSPVKVPPRRTSFPGSPIPPRSPSPTTPPSRTSLPPRPSPKCRCLFTSCAPARQYSLGSSPHGQSPSPSSWEPSSSSQGFSPRGSFSPLSPPTFLSRGHNSSPRPEQPIVGEREQPQSGIPPIFLAQQSPLQNAPRPGPVQPPRDSRQSRGPHASAFNEAPLTPNTVLECDHAVSGCDSPQSLSRGRFASKRVGDQDCGQKPGLGAATEVSRSCSPAMERSFPSYSALRESSKGVAAEHEHRRARSVGAEARVGQAACGNPRRRNENQPLGVDPAHTDSENAPDREKGGILRRNASMQWEYDAFIGHAGEDKNFAHHIHDALERLKLKPFVDEADLHPGVDAHLHILRAASNAPVGLVLMGGTFFNKKWPMRELETIVSQETLLPILYKLDYEKMEKLLSNSWEAEGATTDYAGWPVFVDKVLRTTMASNPSTRKSDKPFLHFIAFSVLRKLVKYTCPEIAAQCPNQIWAERLLVKIIEACGILASHFDELSMKQVNEVKAWRDDVQKLRDSLELS